MLPSSDKQPEAEQDGCWLENTRRHSQEPELPEDSADGLFRDGVGEILRREVANRIMDAISKLALRRAMQLIVELLQMPEGKREAFLQRHYFGHSYREIARKLGVDHKTVIVWVKEVGQKLALSPMGSGKH